MTTTRRKAVILLVIGLLTITSAQIFSHYIELNDFLKGAFMGVGIGLLLIALMFWNLKTLKM